MLVCACACACAALAEEVELCVLCAFVWLCLCSQKCAALAEEANCNQMMHFQLNCMCKCAVRAPLLPVELHWYLYLHLYFQFSGLWQVPSAVRKLLLLVELHLCLFRL